MNKYAIVVTMPTTQGRKKTKNFYPGSAVNTSSLTNPSYWKYKSVPNKIGFTNTILDEIYKTEETEEEIILSKGILKYEVLENDMVNFFEEWNKSLVFKKKDLCAEDETVIDEIIPSNSIDITSLGAILDYVNKVVHLNENVEEFFINNPDVLLNGKLSFDRYTKISIKNVLYNISFALAGIEKMYNAGQTKLLVKNFAIEDFKIEANAKKLSKSVGLPPFALPMIKKLRIEDCIGPLSEIASMVDGNSFKLLLEFIDNYSNFLTIKKLETAKNRIVLLNTFFENLIFIMNEGYKLQDALNYVLRQRMYWNKSEEFGFPFSDTKLFVDYLNLAKSNSFKFEKYPQNLRRMHDIFILNLSDYDENKDKDFIAAVAKYAKYENSLKKDGYDFIVPKNIKALIEEGNSLHHCIGSYIDKIIKGESKIFFMRKTQEKNTSFVTIEIDDNCDIVEIKGMFNQDPEPEIIAIAKKWAGICKRIK